MRYKKLVLLVVLQVCILTKQQDVDKPFADNLKITTTPGFFLSMSKTLLMGKNETVCLSIHHASFPVRVIVDLKIKDKHFYTTKTLDDSDHTCFEVSVPSGNMITINDLYPNESHLANVKVQVQLNGIVYSAHSQDPIVVYPNKPTIFVESDRGIYKAGDKVKIRILVLGSDIRPIKDYKIKRVRIRNPLDITVTAWENVTTQSGLANLEHQLSQESVHGKWRVEAEGEIRTFEVSKYVLPRFQVEIIHPKTVFVETDRVIVTVCSKYSYGGNVKGTAFLRLTDTHHNMKPIQGVQKMKDGCSAFTFTDTDLSLPEIRQKHIFMDPKIHLQMTATVTEYGTDKIEVASTKVPISLKAFTAKFATDNHLLPGLPYQGRLDFANVFYTSDNQVKRGEMVEICYNIAIKKSWNYLNKEQCSNFTLTGKEKSIAFQIPPLRHNVIHLNLNARALNHSNIGDSHLVVRIYSPSSSYIVLDHNSDVAKCRSSQNFTVQFTTDQLRDGDSLACYYVIKHRGGIERLKKITHRIRKTFPNYNPSNQLGNKHKHIRNGSSIDTFVLKFKLDERITVHYQIVVYYVTKSGEVVAATKEVQVDPCLNNKVKANWSHKQVPPGATASLLVETKSDSMCFIAAVDKSVLFMDPQRLVTTSRALLKPFLTEPEVPDSGRKPCLPPIKKQGKVEASSLTDSDGGEWDLRRRRRYVYSFSEDFDAYDVFNKFGTITITNFKVVSKTCYTGPSSTNNNPVQFLTDQYDVQNDEKIAPIRSFFPETWLWEMVPVKDAAVVHRTIPHTITNWVTDVMCVSHKEGVGLSETIEISTYEPFFVDVLTPHSIKKGETLYLHVIVFNHLNYNIPIRITLGDSQGLQLRDLLKRKTVSYCISGNNTVTHVFEVKGTVVGDVNVTILAELDPNYPGQCGPETVVNKRDVVLKTLKVEPEGYPTEKVKSSLLCGSDAKANANITWNFEVPDNAVPGTSSAKLILSGDLLSQAIENLEDIISLPTGCGEQIMASLAPNLYALRYLNATGTLAPSLRARIMRNLKIGYQRILNYAHKDGSFSAFGYHDPSGSMFLTAFVVRTLQEAKNHIFVDQRVVDRAVSWIYDHQLENGCFATMLHVFQDMDGTSTENSTAALTAYVMVSLMDANIPVPDSVKTNAKYCIRGHYLLDKYTLAISAYALLKVHWFSEAFRMLTKLEQLSNQKDNMMWWSNKEVNGSLATDIEISSYVLLSFLHQGTNDNLAKAHSIVRWLTTKMGPKSSFRSTQDTVVALDALARYSTFINGQPLALNVTLTTTSTPIMRVRMTSSDRLPSKRFTLKDPNSILKIDVEGSGCVLATGILSYNLKHVSSSGAFRLNMEVASVSSVDECSIATLAPCFKYNGPDLRSNMAVMEVGLPSGYYADRASLYRLVDGEDMFNTKVKRFEEQDQKVVLYFTKLDKEQVCINFNINENTVVQNRSDSIVKLYDYYKPEYNILQLYSINEKCNKMNNLTLPEIIRTSVASSDESVKNVVKRSVGGMNPDFVEMDLELAVPEGREGTYPVYMKPNSSTILNVNNSLTDDGKDVVRDRRRSQLNPQFVNMDIDMDMPEGLEGNRPSFSKPSNRTMG